MAHHHDKNRYALAVGHAAIEWNYLEHDLQQIGFRYLTVDADIAAHIFAFMGNVSRAEFIAWLVEKVEADKAVVKHIRYFLEMYARLRANRNVVEHGVPALTRSGAYLDEIIKIDRRGDALPFAASQEMLDAFLQDLRAAREYAGAIKRLIDPLTNDDGPQIDAASLNKPAMPERLSPLAFRKDNAET